MRNEQVLTNRRIWIVVGLLALLMFVTRCSWFHLSVYCANASMAVFILGGIYVRRHWAFASLVLLAVSIDYVAMSYAGTSSYCITPAYGCLLVSYAVLWYGGRLLAGRGFSRPMQFGGALVFASLAFVISNGSFYWLGGRVADPDMTGWIANFTNWAPLFIGTTLAYVGVVLLAHEVWARVHVSRPVQHVA
ncbi:MAG: hypothetical protein ACREPY_09745 [Rhodanobacteraceae bacterium]